MNAYEKIMAMVGIIFSSLVIALWCGSLTLVHAAPAEPRIGSEIEASVQQMLHDGVISYHSTIGDEGCPRGVAIYNVTPKGYTAIPSVGMRDADTYIYVAVPDQLSTNWYVEIVHVDRQGAETRDLISNGEIPLNSGNAVDHLVIRYLFSANAGRVM